MTDIDFHVNAPDKLSHASRLVRKAVATGARVVVTGEGRWLESLDLALWQLFPSEFVAHCHASAEASVLARSPIVLAEGLQAALPHRQVLVNLGSEVPVGFEGFERLIEVIADDEAELQAGRLRWKHYASRGYSLKKHPLRSAP